MIDFILQKIKILQFKKNYGIRLQSKSLYAIVTLNETDGFLSVCRYEPA